MAAPGNDQALAARLRRLYGLLLARFGPQGWWPARTRFEVIVGAILTQNTSWVNVRGAIQSLRGAGALNPRAMAALPLGRLASLVKKSGYYNTKARRLQSFLAAFRDHFSFSLRRMFREAPSALRRQLLAIPGIGPETADSILLYAGDVPTFVVDAYTRRVLARHGLIDPVATYNEIQALFMANLAPDRRLYSEYHALLVAVGKDFCLKRDPRCEACPLRSDLPSGGPLPFPAGSRQRAAGSKG